MTDTGPKIYGQTVRVKGKEYERVVVDFGTVDGKRERKTLGTEVEANAAIEKRVLFLSVSDAERLLVATRRERSDLVPYAAPSLFAVCAPPRYTERTHAEYDPLFSPRLRGLNGRPRSCSMAASESGYEVGTTRRPRASGQQKCPHRTTPQKLSRPRVRSRCRPVWS